MRSYQYSGVDGGGKRITGTMMARDESNLEERLLQMGIWLLESAPLATQSATSEGRPEKISLSTSRRRRELINFCTLMNFLVKVGVPLVQALEIAAQDCSHPRLKAVLVDIKKQIESGSQLHEALGRYPKLFNLQFSSLIRAGEQSGALPDSFQQLKFHLEWQDQIAADVRQATIYPTIVLFMVIVFVLTLFTFVVPKFATLLTATKVALPVPTQIVLGISDFALATWWLWLGGLVGLPIFAILFRKIFPQIDIWVDRLKFAAPLFGELNLMLTVSRFARSLSVLYKSGIPIVQSLHLCMGMVNSPIFARCIKAVAARIEQGENLSDALREHPEFPNLLLRMVVTGEKTGSLDLALDNTADYYNLIIPRRIKKIFSILEPSLIIFLVAVVGFVAMAIFLPILSLMDSIR